jgi:hypothetical protein
MSHSALLRSVACTESLSTTSEGRGFTGSGRAMDRSTARPTICSVSDRASASLVWTVPTTAPLRSVITRSEMASTSLSLWVMMMIAQPSSRILRRIVNSLSISCGVRTAVGSSRIRMREPR